jgi:hypothetical protein
VDLWVGITACRQEVRSFWNAAGSIVTGFRVRQEDSGNVKNKKEYGV